MSDRSFVYLIVGILIAHFLVAIIYLFYKISSPGKSKEDKEIKNIQIRKTNENESN